MQNRHSNSTLLWIGGAHLRNLTHVTNTSIDLVLTRPSWPVSCQKWICKECISVNSIQDDINHTKCIPRIRERRMNINHVGVKLNITGVAMCVPKTRRNKDWK
jgi:hypothetical protein